MMQPEPVPFTMAGVWRGFRRGQVLVFGVLAYGVAFGLVASQASLTMMQALLMSAAIYSGSAQLAAVGVLAAGATTLLAALSTLVATILVMNARYVLYSATLRPWLGAASPLQAYGTLFLLGDGSWLLSMRAHEEGERDAGFLFGSSLATFLPWLVGTFIGVLAIGFAPEPRKLGLDFFLVAFAAAMMVGMAKARRDLWVVGIAAVVAVVVERLTNFGAAVVAAGIAGGLAVFLRPERTGEAR